MKQSLQPWFMAITASAYAWQVHGWVWGLAILMLVLLLIPAATAALFYVNLAKSTDPLLTVKRSVQLRWALWVVVMGAIALSGATIRSV